MTNVLTATLPAPDNRNYNEVKRIFIKRMGLNAYLKSFKEYLDTTSLTEDEKSIHFEIVRSKTIMEMQRNFKLN